MPRLRRLYSYVERHKPQQHYPDPDADYCAVLLEFREWSSARGQPFRREMIAAMRAWMSKGRDTQGGGGSE